jgi:prolyl-tRNA synthetase
MRWSRYLLQTLREVPADAEVASHRLMLRAGLIRKASAGLYTYLPGGLRSIRKLETIIREELDRAGCIEVEVPILQPRELWEESGRWSRYAEEGILFHLKDRKGGEFALAPTAEEAVTDIVRSSLNSHRQLPIHLYQIRTKFRDEIRPRFGLLRGREFLMEDGYSFDVDQAGLDVSYQAMDKAYRAIFRRCGLDFTLVEADSGNIGGRASEEFMVLAASGEDAVARCAACNYGANVEKATTGAISQPPALAGEMKKVHTPDVTSIEAVAKFLDLPPERFVKALIYETEKGLLMVLVRGDIDGNELKIRSGLGLDHLTMASDAKVEKATGGAVGFSGPIGLPEGIEVVADESIRSLEGAVVGANEKDHHIVGVRVGVDFEVARWGDFRVARAGDPCPRCPGTLEVFRGIEVGHIFKLGTKYSEALGCTYLDESSVRKPMIMGTYGLGVGRTIASAVEQNHDDDGIIWPIPLAPWSAIVTSLAAGGDAEVTRVSNEILAKLEAAGVDTILDDRDERPGVKFKDADLVGIPLRITVGSKGLKEGKVEFSTRREKGSKTLLPPDEAVARVVELFREAKAIA